MSRPMRPALAGSVLALLSACASEPAAVGRHASGLDSERRGVWEASTRGAVSVNDHARLVFDESRGQVLLVSSRPTLGVWAWNGSQFDPIADPIDRFYRQGATYDGGRQAIVIFGGQAADDTAADTSKTTWVLDAGGLRVASQEGPSARGGAALAYDAARDRVVLVGGTAQRTGASLTDTWLFDGTSWVEATPPTPAPAVTIAGLAYDTVRERVVLARANNDQPGETWEWDGTTWASVTTATPLPAAWSYALAWDPDRARVLALANGQLWQLDGASWSRLDAGDTTNADDRRYGSIAYDPNRHRVVAYRGGGTVWEHDGSGWIAVRQPAPIARHSAAIAYDADRDRIVLTGGYAEAYLADTWEWDGDAWSAGPDAPAGAYETGLAYDPDRHHAAMVADGRTWGWDGDAWSDLGAADGVQGTLLVHDAARRQLVAHAADRTWVHDGSSWTELVTAPPTSVRDAMMAYDAGRQRVVRFGGYTDGSGTSEIDETWELDGSAWTQAQPASSPSRRGGGAMSYDSDRGVVMLFGGYEHAETWEYDGQTWTQRLTPSAPPGAFGNGLVYDAARRRTIFYATDGRLWEYYPVGDACTADGDCASGHCIDSVCCDHACPGACWVCSTAAGGSTDGWCEAVPDAGPECEIPDGGALPWQDAGDGGGGGDEGGCCRIAGPRPAPRGAGLMLALAAALLTARRRFSGGRSARRTGRGRAPR